MKDKVSFFSWFCIGVFLSTVFIVFAAQYYQVNNGTTAHINEHGYDRCVTNNNGNNLFVPTNSAYEWTSFINSPPSGVSVGSAGCNSCYGSASEWYVTAQWDFYTEPTCSWGYDYSESSQITFYAYYGGAETYYSECTGSIDTGNSCVWVSYVGEYGRCYYRSPITDNAPYYSNNCGQCGGGC